MLLCNNRDAEQQRSDDDAIMAAMVLANMQKPKRQYRPSGNAIGGKGMEMLEIAEKIRDLAFQLQLQREQSNVNEKPPPQLDETLQQSLQQMTKTLEDANMNDFVKQKLRQASSTLKICKDSTDSKSKTPKAGNLSVNSRIADFNPTIQRGNNEFTSAKTPRRSNVTFASAASSHQNSSSVPLTTSSTANLRSKVPRSLATIEEHLAALQTTLNQKSARNTVQARDKGERTPSAGNKSHRRSDSWHSNELSLDFGDTTDAADALENTKEICVSIMKDSDIKIQAPSSVTGITLRSSGFHNSGLTSAPPNGTNRLPGKLWNMLRGRETLTENDQAGSNSWPPPSNEMTMFWTDKDTGEKFRQLNDLSYEDISAAQTSSSSAQEGDLTSRQGSSVRTTSSSSSSSLTETIPFARSSRGSIDTDDVIEHMRTATLSQDEILRNRSASTTIIRPPRVGQKLQTGIKSVVSTRGKKKYSKTYGNEFSSPRSDFPAIDTCPSNLSSASGFLSPQDNRKPVKYRSVKNDYEKGFEIIIQDQGQRGRMDGAKMQVLAPVGDLPPPPHTTSSAESPSPSRYDSQILRERSLLTEQLRHHQRKLEQFQQAVDKSYIMMRKNERQQSSSNLTIGSKEERTQAVLSMLDYGNSSSSLGSLGSATTTGLGPTQSSTTTTRSESTWASSTGKLSIGESSSKYSRAIIRD